MAATAQVFDRPLPAPQALVAVDLAQQIGVDGGNQPGNQPGNRATRQETSQKWAPNENVHRFLLEPMKGI